MLVEIVLDLVQRSLIPPLVVGIGEESVGYLEVKSCTPFADVVCGRFEPCTVDADDGGI